MRAPHDAVLRQGAYRLYAGRAGGGIVEAGAAHRYLRPPPADPGAPDRPDRGRDRRGLEAPRRCRADRGGAYLHVGARRRQAWRDDVHQPVHRHVPRQSGGTAAFPVPGARTEPVTSLASLIDAFSSREPASTSLENAMDSARPTVSTSKHDHDIEEGLEFQPKFDASGLVTCVATDAGSGDVLMVAHMNDEALRRTIASGEAWYFSRSRNALWRKGETSGHVQRVVEMRLDCDQDAIWIRVEQTGAACHTGRRSCFYRKVDSADGSARLSFVDAERQFDPAQVYRK